MKLETSEEERTTLYRVALRMAAGLRVLQDERRSTGRLCEKALRDIDTLLTEVERLREDKLFKAQVDKIASLYARIDELTDRASPRWPGVWRPIETALKDEHVLVWAPSAHGLPAMFSVCLWHPDAGFCVDELRTPTHWSPLPEPPHE